MNIRSIRTSATHLAVAALLLLASGCTSARVSRNLSSGAIGCPAGQIQIKNETATMVGGMHNWEADCAGKHFICSYQQTTGVNCKESLVATDHLEPGVAPKEGEPAEQTSCYIGGEKKSGKDCE